MCIRKRWVVFGPLLGISLAFSCCGDDENSIVSLGVRGIHEHPSVPAWSCLVDEEQTQTYGIPSIDEHVAASLNWGVGVGLVLALDVEYEYSCSFGAWVVAPVTRCQLDGETGHVESSDESIWRVADGPDEGTYGFWNLQYIEAMGPGTAELRVSTDEKEWVSFELTAFPPVGLELGRGPVFVDPSRVPDYNNQEPLAWPAVDSVTMNLSDRAVIVMPRVSGASGGRTCGYPVIEVTTSGVVAAEIRGSSTNEVHFRGNWPFVMLATGAGTGALELRLGDVTKTIDVTVEP